jgi:hypothetical protein
MNINLIKSARDLVYNLQLESGLTSDQISELYAIEEWEVEVFNAEKRQANRGSEARHLIKGSVARDKLSKDLLKTDKLKSLYEYLQSDSLKTVIVDALYEDAEFKRLWGLNKESLLKLTKLVACFIIDRPGLHVKVHLDNRMLIGTGMIYLNELSDSRQSTIFYTDDQRSNPMEMPTGFQNGWFAANTHNSWHEGFNLAPTNRLSVLLMLKIIIPNT